MRNTIACLFALFAGINFSFAQITDGGSVPNFSLETILNAPVKNVKLEDLKNKIVLLEFWATWCGPCIEAMPHLEQLQKKYPNKLQIITITNETSQRIENFLLTKPFKLWFAIDTSQSINKLFPHGIIPHTVLISQDGKLISNTSPEFVTDKIIDSLLDRKNVHLVEKKEILLSSQEIIKSYFFVSDTVKNRFFMQGEIKGVPTFMQTYTQDSIFKNRRITCVNFNLSLLYRIAEGSPSSQRVINKISENDEAVKYCLDLIVTQKEKLWPTLKKELSIRFDIQSKTETMDKDVYVLKIIDKEKFRKIPVNKSGEKVFNANGGSLDSKGISMKDLANYFEDFHIVSLPVIDETNVNDKFDIKFSFHREDSSSLTQILDKMGLAIEKASRKIDMLVIYKQ